MKYYRYCNIWTWIIFAVIITSCEKEIEIEFPKTEQQYVVDGWIEQGNYAKVIVTQSMPYVSTIDSATYRDLVITKAKVVLTNGNASEILTLTRDTNYFPPYIYTGTQIQGKVGENYKLTIYIKKQSTKSGAIKKDTLQAQTKIPKPPEIIDIWTEQAKVKDSIVRLKLKFIDNPNKSDFYHLKIKESTQGSYINPYISIFSDKKFNGDSVSMPVFWGTKRQKAEDIYFYYNDTIDLKFCTMDKASFNFWQGYQQEKVSALNPFSTTNKNIQGNVTGGLGIWCGYGVTKYRIRIMP